MYIYRINRLACAIEILIDVLSQSPFCNYSKILTSIPRWRRCSGHIWAVKGNPHPHPPPPSPTPPRFEPRVEQHTDKDLRRLPQQSYTFKFLLMPLLIHGRSLWVSWLSRRLRACVVQNIAGSRLSSVPLPLYCMSSLSGQWTMETNRTRKERLAT